MMKEVLSVVFLSAAHLSFYDLHDQNHGDSMSKFKNWRIIHSAGKMLIFD